MRVPAVIDIEASGFGKGSYPVEVGYVLPDGRRYCTLIRPQPEWTHWDAAAERLHRIPLSVLRTRGRAPAEVCARLDADLGGRTVYSDAWSHDLSWLHRLYDAAGSTPAFRLESVRALLDETELSAWHPAREAVMRDLRGERHRASVDALAVQRALCRLKGLSVPEAAALPGPAPLPRLVLPQRLAG